MGVSRTMKTNHPEKSTWVGVELSVRQHYMANKMTVPYPAIVRVLGELKRGAERCKNEHRGSAMLVLAGSGCGKSHLINLIANLSPPDHSGNVSLFPVVHFRIPSAPTQKGLGIELLRALEQPKANMGSAQDLFNRSIHYLKVAQTRIIMIDDVQDIPERRSVGGVMQVGNWIRDLIDESQCLVVLFGTPAAKQITEKNAQLKRRVPKQMVIRYFDIENDESVRVFSRFLREVDKRLPLAELSKLDELSLVHSIYWATGGISDYIFELLNEAVIMALKDGREHISRGDLKCAFDCMFQDAAVGVNPFSEGGPQRLLDQPNEPFHNWFDISNPKLDK